MYSHEEENTYSQYDLCDLYDLHCFRTQRREGIEILL